MGVIVRGGWRNGLTLPVIEGLGIPVMHTWNQSVPLWVYHHGFQVISLYTRAKKMSCAGACEVTCGDKMHSQALPVLSTAHWLMHGIDERNAGNSDCSLHGCGAAGEGRLHTLVPPQRVPAVDLAVLLGAAAAGACAATSARSRHIDKLVEAAARTVIPEQYPVSRAGSMGQERCDGCEACHGRL